jgi:hypothetical protein
VKISFSVPKILFGIELLLFSVEERDENEVLSPCGMIMIININIKKINKYISGG